ncbi:MAG: hypothetical protein JWN62_3121 [Acidimicrobiales bacterium]|nr:hypothetical protein [Acidimicrobiales bacterium]
MINTSAPRRSRRLMLCGAIALSSLGLTGITLSGVAHAAPAHQATVRTAPADGTADDGTSDSPTSTDGVTTDDSSATDDTTVDDSGVGDWGNWDDTQWIAESNAEQDQLAAYLDAHGIAYTIETDEGATPAETSHWVDVDYTDQAASDTVDDFYWSLYPTSQADIDAYNAETDSLVSYFQAHGVDVTVTTDRHGYRDAEWNYDDANAESVYEDYEWDQYPTSPEDIASMNADTEAENAYLVAHGFTATITTDKHGIETDVYDENDDAVWTALDDYWSTQYGVDGVYGTDATDGTAVG